MELEPKLDDAQLTEIVDEVDEDGSGTIDFDGNNVYKTEQTTPKLHSQSLFSNNIEFMAMMMG